MFPSEDEPDVAMAFVVDSPHQVRDLLYRMIEQRCQILADLGPDSRSLVSAVLELSEDGRSMLLDPGPDAAINAYALRLDRLTMTSRIDRVPVRFECGRLEKVFFQGQPAFRAAVPARLHYAQQRQFFRIPALGGLDLRCRIELPAKSQGAARQIDFPVIDLSLGGMALLCPESERGSLARGMSLAQVGLRVPGQEELRTPLRVINIGSIETARGETRQRIGCAFQPLDPLAQKALQRFIVAIERTRIARERGTVVEGASHHADKQR
jgi:c-di-GMP-binding flagellar brake protein YcgR